MLTAIDVVSLFHDGRISKLSEIAYYVCELGFQDGEHNSFFSVWTSWTFILPSHEQNANVFL